MGSCVGGIPSDYFVSTQLQLWLFCCWGCGFCWAVTINVNCLNFFTLAYYHHFSPRFENYSSHKRVLALEDVAGLELNFDI